MKYLWHELDADVANQTENPIHFRFCRMVDLIKKEKLTDLILIHQDFGLMTIECVEKNKTQRILIYRDCFYYDHIGGYSGRRIRVSSDGRIRIWEYQKGKLGDPPPVF